MSKRDTKLVVIGVVYPEMQKYLDDYLNSLEEQTYQEFDLLIANDGIDNFDGYLEERNFNGLSFVVSGSVSDNRRDLIRKAIVMGYRKIIFTDTDDVFEENRVELMSDLLDSNRVVVNDLDITDINGKTNISRYFSRRFKNCQSITKSTLLEGNMMGLSNTAVRSEVLYESPALKGGNVIAFDWYLWSSVLLSGNEAYFTSETSTKYRVYDDNIAGLPQPLDEINILKGIKVKSEHYEIMSRLDPSYKKMANEYRGIQSKLNNNDWYIKYIDSLKKRAIEIPMWWENIRMTSEFEFYEDKV